MDVWTHTELQGGRLQGSTGEHPEADEPPVDDTSAIPVARSSTGPTTGPTTEATSQVSSMSEGPIVDSRRRLEMSAETLRDVKFREKFRGYHPDDVDEFLEQVAEGIEYLHGKLRTAQQTAGGAEPADPSSPAAIENDEALRRTLVLAQRTAQLAVQEARHEAERIQSEARARAEAVMSRAEEAARRTVEETNERLRGEVGKLEAARDRLRADVADLERYLDEQRRQLQSSLSEALARVDQVVPQPARPAPEPAAVEVPPVPWPDPVPRRDIWEPPADAAPHAEPEADEEPEPYVEPEAYVEPEPERQPEPRQSTVFTTSDFEFGGDPAGTDDESGIWAAVPEDVDEDAWTTAEAHEAPAPDDDDPFIAELRRAITDTSPLGPRDDAMPEPLPEVDDRYERELSGERRFRRKRR
jgi:DivIVA domain-containing protein